MDQDNPDPAFLRLERAVTRLERLVQITPQPSPQRAESSARDELSALKRRHLLLRARAQTAVDGIDALLKES